MIIWAGHVDEFVLFRDGVGCPGGFVGDEFAVEGVVWGGVGGGLEAVEEGCA